MLGGLVVAWVAAAAGIAGVLVFVGNHSGGGHVIGGLGYAWAAFGSAAIIAGAVAVSLVIGIIWLVKRRRAVPE